MNNPRTGAPRGASDLRGADMVAGASQILSASNRRSPFLLLHKLSVQKQHLEKQQARALRRSEAVLRKAALIEAQMARLSTSLGTTTREGSNPSPPQLSVPPHAALVEGSAPRYPSTKRPTLNAQRSTPLKEVRHRY